MKTKKTFLLFALCLLCSAQVWAQYAWENQHLPIEWTEGDYHFGVQPRWGAGIATGLVTFRGYSGPDDFTTFEVPATVEVPQGVADQFSEMFEGTDFTLPAGTATVKVVGRDAFNGYSTATSIIVPEGVTIIKEAAFSNMNHLASVSLPHSLESMEQAIFSNSPITAITLSENVSYIQELAFCYCSIATFTVLCETPLAPHTGGDAGVAANAFNIGGPAMASRTLYVPFGAGPAYTAAPIWSEFGTIIELPASNDADLSSLTVSAGTLTPDFDPAVTEYTVDVLQASITITAVANNSANAIVTGAGEKDLSVGENTFPIEITAQDGLTKKTYTIVVTRTLSTDATLKKLAVSAGTLSPAFDPEITDYTVSVANTQSNIFIEAVVNHITSSLTGDGMHDLTVGENTFPIVVTAEDESTKTYTVVVTRAQAVGIAFTANEAAASVTYNAGNLSVNSSYTEQVCIYSVTGSLVYKVQKPAGEATFGIDLQDRIVIVQGNSGWTKKVVLIK
ncbi:MAG: cadherin-like beta sandwich domain-containing protein [Candidatus Symbiothrix sp.]|jgi:hypothetical protein|nr:cadherin-like beta sandwich domain-containing protein [Candidatus Symbiothrix sp.]